MQPMEMHSSSSIEFGRMDETKTKKSISFSQAQSQPINHSSQMDYSTSPPANEEWSLFFAESPPKYVKNKPEPKTLQESPQKSSDRKNYFIIIFIYNYKAY